MSRRLKVLHIIIAILFFCTSLSCFALPSDDKKMIHIFASSSLFNYKTGVTTYEGDVKIDQGSTRLTADKVITENNGHRITSAIAYGIQRLANYTTLPKEGDPVFHAKAHVIKFYPDTSTVILEGNVIVTQGENSFQGPLIIYNMKDQTVTAPASKAGRATIVIDPTKLKS